MKKKSELDIYCLFIYLRFFFVVKRYINYDFIVSQKKNKVSLYVTHGCVSVRS